MPSSESAAPAVVDADTHKRLAIALFNHVWSLLERTDRTAADDDAMVHAAHASVWHWSQVGTAQNRAIGEWQVARVYSELGRGEAAVHHAHRADDLGRGLGVPWLTASGLESLARAYAVAGRRDEALAWRDRAVEALATVTDPENHRIVESDIASLPL